MATQYSILAWRIPWAEEPGRATVHKELDITEQTEHKLLVDRICRGVGNDKRRLKKKKKNPNF